MKKFSAIFTALMFIILSCTVSFAGIAVQDDGVDSHQAIGINYQGGTPSVVGGFLVIDTAPITATIAIGAEATNEIAATVTIKDASGTTIASDYGFDWWLSETAGAATSATAPDIDLTVSGGVSVVEHTANLHGTATTGSDGISVITVGDDDTDTTWYLNILVANKVISSAAITHA